MLRRVLAEIEAGRLEARGVAGELVRRRLKGAVLALDAVHPLPRQLEDE